MSTLPYLNPDLPVAVRVKDLLARLTLPEKIGQMINHCQAVPRLNIPAYDYWSEALHGVARNGKATVFPQAIGMAATWDTALIQRIGSAIGDEGRAKFHAALRRNGSTSQYQGLTFWSPNINIFRDPRWGRGQETYGEDPYLTGEMGAAFVRGLQGDHPKYMKAAACAKHYAVHSGPEKDRHHFNARVSLRDLHDTYLPAFKKLVTEAKVEAVMGAYNRVNDEPCCAHEYLLDDVLRGQWGFTGHVTSDCWALTDIHAHHHCTEDVVQTAALAVKRGCDISCECTYDHLGEAVQRGLCSEADIDRCLERTLATRFKLGLFDPPEQVPFASMPESIIGCQEHKQLAYQAALESIVLLKNQNNLLPIRPETRSIMVIGPNAAAAEVLLGNYHGLSSSLVTFLEGIAGRAPEGMSVNFRTGCQLDHPNANPADWAGAEAAQCDVVVACMGISPLIEGEEGESILSHYKGDRKDLSLPPSQVEFLKQLASRGAKIVLVLCGGSPIALGELEDMVQAVVFVWYPGQEGGRALAHVLFGDAVPSGKLPLTFPRSVKDLPPFDDYRMAGRTYRYSKAEPLYPFGFGLSYTRFLYSDLRLDQQKVKLGENLTARLSLTNTGKVEAEEVIQCYLSDLQATTLVPLHKLASFQRVRLAAGECRTIEFTITPEMMAFIDDRGEPCLEPGEFRLTIGSASPGKRALYLGAPEPVASTFSVEI